MIRERGVLKPYDGDIKRGDDIADRGDGSTALLNMWRA